MNYIAKSRRTAEAHTTGDVDLFLRLFAVISAATVSLALPAIVLAEQSVEIVAAADGHAASGWVAVLASLMTLSFLFMLAFATRVLIACCVWRPGSALSTSTPPNAALENTGRRIAATKLPVRETVTDA